MQQISAFIVKRKNWLSRALVFVLPVILLVISLSQTAFAQNTYVITDGDQVRIHTTSASDPKEVLTEAGFQLEADDTFTTKSGADGTRITVQRAQMITINNCGKQLQISSYGESLEELLDRMDVELQEDYVLSEGLNTQTYDGMDVTISWVVRQNQTSTHELPFETIYCDDPSLEAGLEQVAQEGVNGQVLRTDEVVYVNGVEDSRSTITEEVLTNPRDQVILRGTGAQTNPEDKRPIIGDGVIILPDGEVLTYTHYDYFKATAYTSWIEDVTDITATGTKARVGAIAVDPKVIPYGTRMFIVTNDGAYIYGIATAEDCGGGVKGNHVDLFFDTEAECWQFGVRKSTIYFLGDADWRGDTSWRKSS